MFKKFCKEGKWHLSGKNPNPDERDKCLEQIIFLPKNKKTICKALIRMTQEFRDLVVDGSGQLLFVFAGRTGNDYRVTDPDCDGAGAGKKGFFRQNRIGADKGDRDDGNSGLDGQEHGAPLEGLKGAVSRPGSFRKDKDRGAGLDPVRSLMQAFQGFPAMAAIDSDAPGSGHGAPKKRGLEQLFLGQPAKGEGEIALEAEDVKLAEVVGTIDITGL